MAYTKTNWQNDQAPAINATNLNKIEQGIFNNDALLSSIMNTLGIDTQTWVSTDSYVEGQVVVYNNQLYKNITGNYTTTPPDEDTTNWSLTNIKDMQYPVGKVEIFYDTLDHSNYMGFTWERTSVGKVPVGLDTNDSDFDTIGETGGTKSLKLSACIGAVNNSADNLGYNAESQTVYQNNHLSGLFIHAGSGSTFNNWNHSTPVVESDKNERNVTNLQPYQVFAIWKRIS